MSAFQDDDVSDNSSDNGSDDGSDYGSDYGSDDGSDDDPKNAPLHDAALNDYIDAATALLDAEGFDINIRNNNNQTPLHVAAINNSVKVAKLLIENGADIEALSISFNSPLNLAVSYTNVDVFRLLIDAGANVNQENIDNDTPLALLVINEYKKKVTEEIMTTLIKKGADANQKNQKGHTILQRAIVELNDDPKILENIKALINTGKADLNVLDQSNNTLVNYVVQYIRDDMLAASLIRSLVKNGVDVNKPNVYGNTPMHMVSMLCENDSNCERIETANVLIDAKADVNAMNKVFVPPIVLASDSGYTDLVELLLKNGADIKFVKKKDGNTTLHFAAKRNNYEMAEFLRENGANMLAKNIDGKTPADLTTDPKLKALLSTPLPIIPAQIDDPISMDNIDVEAFLKEHCGNKIFKFDRQYILVSGKEIQEKFFGRKLKQYTFYPCNEVGKSIVPRETNVDRTKPIFPLNVFTFLQGYVSLDEFENAMNSLHRYFEISTENQVRIPAVTSLQMLGNNPNAVGAKHCQEGTDAVIYKIVRIDKKYTGGNKKHVTQKKKKMKNKQKRTTGKMKKNKTIRTLGKYSSSKMNKTKQIKAYSSKIN